MYYPLEIPITLIKFFAEYEDELDGLESKYLEDGDFLVVKLLKKMEPSDRVGTD